MDIIFKLINLSEYIIGYPIIAIYWILKDKTEINSLFSLGWELAYRISIIIFALIVTGYVTNLLPKIVKELIKASLMILSLTLIGIGIYGILLNLNIPKLTKGNNFSLGISLNFFESIFFFFLSEITTKMNKMIIKDEDLIR